MDSRTQIETGVLPQAFYNAWHVIKSLFLRLSHGSITLAHVANVLKRSIGLKRLSPRDGGESFHTQRQRALFSPVWDFSGGTWADCQRCGRRTQIRLRRTLSGRMQLAQQTEDPSKLCSISRGPQRAARGARMTGT